MKYYAVRVGREGPRIYTSWDEARVQVQGFSGAVYKSFSSENEAKSFLGPPSESAPRLEIAELVLYTDGACPNNGFGSKMGGVGVFLGPNDPRNISETVIGPHVTNNHVELLALYRALEICATHPGPCHIYTDSMYGLNCCKHWRQGWKIRGWKKTDGTTILNQDLVKQLDHLLETNQLVDRVTFYHVRGHNGHYGNEMADQLASRAAQKSS